MRKCPFTFTRTTTTSSTRDENLNYSPITARENLLRFLIVGP